MVDKKYQSEKETKIYAGFVKRLIAAFVDFLFVTAITLFFRLLFILTIFLIFLILRTGPGSIMQIDKKVFIVVLVLVTPILIFIRMLVAWLYFAIMESSNLQATLGKMALGIKVTNLDRNKISFARATGRHFGKYISLAIFGIGFIMIAFTPRHQGLHDILAETLVLKKEQQ